MRSYLLREPITRAMTMMILAATSTLSNDYDVDNKRKNIVLSLTHWLSFLSISLSFVSILSLVIIQCRIPLKNFKKIEDEEEYMHSWKFTLDRQIEIYYISSTMEIESERRKTPKNMEKPEKMKKVRIKWESFSIQCKDVGIHAK